jgi:hypothetical protein
VQASARKAFSSVGGDLPFTGIDLNALLAILGCAVLLLAAGAAMVTISRRRGRD